MPNGGILMDPMMKAFEEAKNNSKMRKKLRIKSVFTILLFVAFIGVIILTIGTIISAKQGAFLGITHIQFLKLKANYGILMLLLILIHLGMNWKIFKKEISFLGKG